MTRQKADQVADPARIGAEVATQIISAQAAAGMSIGRMTNHAHNTAAWLFSEASTANSEKFAASYTETAESLLAELRETRHPSPDMRSGAPHPDPVLAAKGWQACEHGGCVHVRRPASYEIDREPEA